MANSISGVNVMGRFICRVLFVVVCAFVLASAANASAAITFIQWTTGTGANNHYYGITDDTSNWTTAEATAVALGGHLVAINSADENNFIVTTFLTSGAYSTLPIWVGLTDNTPYGNGATSKIYNTWTTGEAVTFTDWQSGEPNNASPGEDYGAINWHFAGGYTTSHDTWNDTPLNGSSGYAGTTDGPYFGLVELDALPSGLPEASTLVIFAGLLGCAAWKYRRAKAA